MLRGLGFFFSLVCFFALLDLCGDFCCRCLGVFNFFFLLCMCVFLLFLVGWLVGVLFVFWVLVFYFSLVAIAGVYFYFLNLISVTTCQMIYI